MRNNPRNGAKLEYAELFETLAKTEQIRRFFVGKRKRIFKHFALQPYHTNFCKKDVAEYISSLDLLLMMDRRLIENFTVEENFSEYEDDEQVGFDSFYDILSGWAIEQTELTFEDFSAIDQDRKERLDDYKRKVDNMI